MLCSNFVQQEQHFSRFVIEIENLDKKNQPKTFWHGPQQIEGDLRSKRLPFTVGCLQLLFDPFSTMRFCMTREVRVARFSFASHSKMAPKGQIQNNLPVFLNYVNKNSIKSKKFGIQGCKKSRFLLENLLIKLQLKAKI